MSLPKQQLHSMKRSQRIILLALLLASLLPATSFAETSSLFPHRKQKPAFYLKLYYYTPPYNYIGSLPYHHRGWLPHPHLAVALHPTRNPLRHRHQLGRSRPEEHLLRPRHSCFQHPRLQLLRHPPLHRSPLATHHPLCRPCLRRPPCAVLIVQQAVRTGRPVQPYLWRWVRPFQLHLFRYRLSRRHAGTHLPRRDLHLLPFGKLQTLTLSPPIHPPFIPTPKLHPHANKTVFSAPPVAF